MKLNKMMGMGAMSVGVATALVAATAGSAAASPATPPSWHVIKTISSAYVGPLQFAIDGHNVVVADSFTSTLTIVGRPTPLAVGPRSVERR